MDTIIFYLYTLIGALASIPPVIWSGVIASVLTLGGVLIANSSNTKRLRIQLKHDADQKDADRKSAIRREVYLELAKEATKASNYLGSIASVDMAKEDINEGFNDYFIAANKLLVIAENKTSFAVNELSSELSTIVLEIMPDLYKISLLTSNIKSYQQLYDNGRVEINRILAAMTAFNESPLPKNQDTFEMLQLSYDQQTELSEQTTKTLNGFFEKKVIGTIEFAQRILPRIGKISELQLEVLFCIREEIGLSTDKEAMVQQTLRMRNEQQTNLNNLIATFKSELNEVFVDSTTVSSKIDSTIL